MIMNIFTAMREDLEKHGWHQGNLYAVTDALTRQAAPACLQGAYNRCETDQPVSIISGKGAEVSRKLTEAIAELYPDWEHVHPQPSSSNDALLTFVYPIRCSDWCVAVQFNDDKCTSYEDVIRILKHCECLT